MINVCNGNLAHLQTLNLYNNIVNDLEITYFKDYIRHILNIISTTKEVKYHQLSSYYFPLMKESIKEVPLTNVKINYSGIQYIKDIFEKNNVTIITLNMSEHRDNIKLKNFLVLISTILENEENLLGIILKSNSRNEIINVTHPYRIYQILVGQIDLEIFNYCYIYKDESLGNVETNESSYEDYMEQLDILSEKYASNLLETFEFITKMNNNSELLSNNQIPISLDMHSMDLSFMLAESFLQDSTEVSYLKDSYPYIQGFSDILLAHRYIPFYCYFDIQLGNNLNSTRYEYAITNTPVLSPNLQLQPKKCCIGNENFDMLGLTSLLISNLNSPFRKEVITDDKAIQKAWIRANLNTTYDIIEENLNSEMLNCMKNYCFVNKRKESNDIKKINDNE